MCVTNSRNITPLFHKKAIPHDHLQKRYPNLARTCENKFYENEMQLNWLIQSKKLLLRYNWKRGEGGGAVESPSSLPRPVLDRVKKSPEKIQFLTLDNKSCKKYFLNIGFITIKKSSEVEFLRITFDKALIFKKHIESLWRVASYKLLQT